MGKRKNMKRNRETREQKHDYGKRKTQGKETRKKTGNGIRNKGRDIKIEMGK